MDMKGTFECPHAAICVTSNPRLRRPQIREPGRKEFRSLCITALEFGGHHPGRAVAAATWAPPPAALTPQRARPSIKSAKINHPRVHFSSRRSRALVAP
jgi:hypothetical protein